MHFLTTLSLIINKKKKKKKKGKKNELNKIRNIFAIIHQEF